MVEGPYIVRTVFSNKCRLNEVLFELMEMQARLSIEGAYQ